MVSYVDGVLGRSIKRPELHISVVDIVTTSPTKAGTSLVLHAQAVLATQLRLKGYMKSFTRRLNVGLGEAGQRERRENYRPLNKECQDC